MVQIVRQTFFRLPAEHHKAAEAAYEKMRGANKKDGRDYIVDLQVYKLHNDPRSGGFTFMARSVFSSLDDMRYYDDQDEAHTELKKTLKPNVLGGQDGVMTVYMDA
ncbi:hypothetical protein BT63DRAFT_408555 [Microthyrium microscopicum]|uniref:Stress-response A/B barrel domain-containing protein n=1 Tax=Microthyrium microscopicum TaxID=703497 RepID=A0A6A6UTH2_9PEZI|nr:hypothetical protein BT63DRAFT_408555 [Microthyrium microscopicum]